MEARVLPTAPDLTELPGEDLTTSALPEVAGWIAIYEELASVLRSVISRADGSEAVHQLRRNLAFIEDRLLAWRDRHAEMAAVVIDYKDHSLTYGGNSIRLTRLSADRLDLRPPDPHATSRTRELAAPPWN